MEPRRPVSNRRASPHCPFVPIAELSLDPPRARIGLISKAGVELSRAESGREHSPVVFCGSAADLKGLAFDRVEKLDSERVAFDAQPGVFSGDPDTLSEALVRADVDHS